MNVVLSFTILEQRATRARVHPPAELLVMVPFQRAAETDAVVGIRSGISAWQAAKLVADYLTRNGVARIRLDGGSACIEAMDLQLAFVQAINTQRALAELARAV